MADGDYIATAGKLTFEPGTTTKTITVAVNGDTKIEADESFWVDLSNVSANAQIQDNAGLGTILRDDPRFNIEVTAIVEGNEGSSEMVINVDLSIPVTNQVRLDFETRNGPGGTGLVSYWPAEGNADDIVGGRNGEVRGATFVDGVIGQAFWCDGNDYIHVNDPGPEGSADLDLTAQATFTGFVHPTAYRQRRYHYQQGKLLRNRRLR